ncbi:deoxyguanosinetriphosphate triphosphohydrolase [Corynebacterium sp. sy017]|uniref:deoxyguanosinetriphosphate triphosphohydrolase n=1 Tax=unclassified Corynebacterium TaxID=2624378 RepID=UPI0011859F69|nr:MULTISPECIES: deoxyguanosinetriphosphate triphosphohydrolase [unclassified Corynebacterium]MBP3088048.1 deoxyguanosinetriphosphate triphosphohydrolase [Corynebacterium sp. sy017]QDZ43003.1 deoxyguanosinetriphosphate triphosphohydrolase [Corynebacterium sp. sy039]TSD92576.1 deoxyguanosinetriphosphate triphosphohydrolase [Corynebacterium sp. SY003]
MSYHYIDQDCQRRYSEGEKGSVLIAHTDTRHPFARDRARVLHSAALRRLADKTQVVAPGIGDTPRTRLTHSLEVAQIARGIGSGLGLNADLCEMAGLTHDIGHPPYGHNGERALDQVAQDCGGFEGNAQTLRILTRLEPKILDESDTSFGLNLTRAALDAACKYPRTKTNTDGSINKKYGCYDEDRDILTWIRQGHTDDRPCAEAQVMDFSDDIAYSVHDVEDGIIAGRITLSVLWDFVELAALAHKGARAFGGEPEQLIDAADRLRDLDVVASAAEFHGRLRDYTQLKAMTSQLVGRYVGAVVSATQEAAQGQPLGRMYGTVVIPEQVWAEVTLLKTIAVLYVMDQPAHLARQDRQRDRIFRVYDYFSAGGAGTLDPLFRLWWEQADTAAQRERVIIDQIASMTESRLERVAAQAAQWSGFLG